MDALITPIPPAASAGSVAAVTSSGSGVGTTQVPSILASLPPGTLLQGYVLNRDAGGNPILRTETGDFLIKSDLFLKIGSDVVVRIDASGRNFRSSIITVDGHVPLQTGTVPAEAEPNVILQNELRASAAQPPPQQTQQQPVATNAAAEPAAPRSPLPLPLLEGTVLRSDTPTTPVALSPGSQVRLQLLSVQLPQGTPAAPEAEHEPLPAAPYAAYQRTNAPTVTTSPQVAYLPAMPATPAAPNLPAPALPAPTKPATTQPQAAVTGTLIQFEPTGEALVRTPLGNVLVNTPISLPVGSTLKLQVLQQSLPGTPLPPATAASAPPLSTLSELGGGWPALQQIANLLADLGGGDAQSILAAMNLPTSPGAGAALSGQNPVNTARGMEANIFFFISVLKSGDFRGWIGERNAKQIEAAGRGDLLQKAEGEFRTLRQAYTEPPPAQWQTLFVPVAVNGEIRPLRWFSKRERKQEGGRQSEGDTRFVVEMELSQLGPLQLDGFVRKRDAPAVQFDLYIRSHTPLDEQTQQDLLRIYRNTGELAGYVGTLTFQATQHFPVNPLEELAAEQHQQVIA